MTINKALGQTLDRTPTLGESGHTNQMKNGVYRDISGRSTILCQEPGRAEKDFGRLPVKTVVKNIYILFSGSELPVAKDEKEEIMDLVDPSTPLPSWFTGEDLHNYAKF